MHSKSHQLCPTLCNPTDVAQEAPLSIGFARREYRSVVLYPLSRDTPHLGIKPETSYISCIGRNVLYHYHHLGSTKYWYKILYMVQILKKKKKDNDKIEKGKI